MVDSRHINTIRFCMVILEKIDNFLENDDIKQAKQHLDLLFSNLNVVKNEI